MSETREFNPIAAAAHIEEAYREYIATTIHFDNAEYQSQLEEILRRKGFLAKGPFLESAPPYTKDRSVTDLVDEGVLCRGMLRLGNGNPEQFDCNRPLYVHQVRAIKKAVQGRNYVVVSGTGSGKTECFLLPILNDILTEFETTGPQPGVRAMMLYPMNALANDQLKRLRTLLQGTGITFGRYTGDTEEDDTQALLKWQEENPGQKKLPNEIISRTEIRKNPPNILLTNYSMLEYLLLRPKDAALFGKAFGGSWRHIAIDEAHVYSGALGTEIAYLLRRLKARIAAETGATPQLHCYATSATIGSEEDLPKIARFASDLFGEPFSVNGDDLDVITSERDLPQDALEPDSWGALPLEAWAALRRALLVNDAPAESICEILRGSGVPKGILNRMEGVPMLLGLGRVLLGEASTATLVSKSAKLIDLTDLAALENLGIPGLRGDDEGVETLTAMVEVLSSAQRTEGVPILSAVTIRS
ncbi:MAG: DEAD/DEAH box helicase [Eggerthellaceae bacterium]|nr:DEAD/DEAH box helicase [Eggerthellaceae bacterium]